MRDELVYYYVLAYIVIFVSRPLFFGGPTKLAEEAHRTPKFSSMLRSSWRDFVPFKIPDLLGVRCLYTSRQVLHVLG